MASPLRFRDGGRTYVVDSCEPLKRAALAGEVELRAFGRGSYPGAPLPRRRMPGLRSVGSWDARRPQGWGLDWHTNEGLELTFVSRGRVPFALGERAWTLGRGDMTITRPWQPHRLGDPVLPANRLAWAILDVGVHRPNQPWRWPDWLLLSREDRDRLTRLLRHNERPVFKAGRRCGEAFESLARLLAAGGSPAAAETPLKLCLNEILISTLEMLEREDLPLDPSLCEGQRLVRWFLEALPGQLERPWTLATMAEACGLHRTRFAHHCRQLTELAPAALLEARRIEAAGRLLLQEPRLPVTEVALRCGFGSSQYFATRFRGATGLTPTAFRARPAPAGVGRGAPGAGDGA